MDKVKEILRREHEQNLKTNDYWLGILQLAYMNELDPRVLLDFDARLESISVDTLKNMAVETLDPTSYVRCSIRRIEPAGSTYKVQPARLIGEFPSGRIICRWRNAAITNG